MFTWWELTLLWVGISPIVCLCVGTFLSRAARLSAAREQGDVTAVPAMTQFAVQPDQVAAAVIGPGATATATVSLAAPGVA